MKVVTGRVVAGKIEVEGGSLEEGSTVTVLAPERDETFLLDSQAEAALIEAMAEADRRATIAEEGPLDKLRKWP